jgi:pilus assembly protein Flp/PilA
VLVVAEVFSGITEAKQTLTSLIRRTTMKNFIRFMKDEEGATAIEYGLIAALISVAAITAMGALGGQLSTLFGNVQTSLR